MKFSADFSGCFKVRQFFKRLDNFRSAFEHFRIKIRDDGGELHALVGAPGIVPRHLDGFLSEHVGNGAFIIAHLGQDGCHRVAQSLERQARLDLLVLQQFAAQALPRAVKPAVGLWRAVR